jgi:hypothetical protein
MSPVVTSAEKPGVLVFDGGISFWGHQNFRIPIRVARWYNFKPRIPIWVNFLGSGNARGLPFGLAYRQSVLIMANCCCCFWYIFTSFWYVLPKKLATLIHI